MKRNEKKGLEIFFKKELSNAKVNYQVNHSDLIVEFFIQPWPFYMFYKFSQFHRYNILIKFFVSIQDKM